MCRTTGSGWSRARRKRMRLESRPHTNSRSRVPRCPTPTPDWVLRERRAAERREVLEAPDNDELTREPSIAHEGNRVGPVPECARVALVDRDGVRQCEHPSAHANPET